jgi:Na+/H+ antiporter NhaD/arsenite permease-like protein
MIEVLILLLIVSIAVGSLPPFNMNRATIALGGTVLLLVLGVIPLQQAFSAIDAGTLTLLFAMMILIGHLRLGGFFELVGGVLAKMSRTPKLLLLLVLFSTAILSSLFINDTVVLMLTPLVTEITLAAGLDPIPFLIALAVSANIGSMTTPLGNPQNILIANASGLGFQEFLSRLWLPATGSLAAAFLIILLFFRKSLRPKPLNWRPTKKAHVYKPLLWKCLVSFLVMAAGIAFHLGLTLSALAGSALLLFTRRIKPQKVFKLVDWNLLVFFASLFVIIRALESTAGFQTVLSWGKPIIETNIPLLSGLSAALSNLISNVPAVMVLKSLIPTFPHPDQAWLVLAAATTLAGNLTLFGSVANLIVAESAKHYGIHLKFRVYLLVGVPLAVISLVLTTLWLMP